MAESPAGIEIPNRPLFKAAEVCELMKLQPYVLRTWEAEFPELGVAKSAGAARVYRRADVQRVAHIKHLLLVEGLTLAGARRRLEAETAPVAADTPAIDELIGEHTRERLTQVKRGLRSILELLAGSHHARELVLTPPPVRSSAAVSSAGRKAEPSKPAARKATATRRKR